jgi:ankyrin repeat protein
MSGNLPNVTTLLSSTYVDPTPYAGSLTPLLVAAKNGHNVTVELLLTNRANIDHQSEKGFTALINAAAWGKKDVVRLLLRERANTTLTTNSKASYPHKTACYWNSNVGNIITGC